VNKVILIGNLGADGEYKVLQNGSGVLNLRLATSETWKDKTSGEKKEKTTWHSVSLFGDRAAKLATHMTKGTKLAVEGSIEVREYEKDGEKRFATSVKATNIEFVGGKKNDSAPSDADDGEISF